MATDLTNDMNATGPRLQLSPPQVPGSTRAPLEIIDMPMWLWVDAPSESALVVPTGDTVTDQVVIDNVVWTLDGGAQPWTTCAATGTAPSGAGVPYDPAFDPANPVPQACVMTNTSPYYATTSISGTATKVDGVHTLTAQVTWHIAYSVTGPNPVPLTPIPASGSNGVPQAGTPLTFRVGEIQALAIGP